MCLYCSFVRGPEPDELRVPLAAPSGPSAPLRRKNACSVLALLVAAPEIGSLSICGVARPLKVSALEAWPNAIAEPDAGVRAEAAIPLQA